jgi:transcriptional regulator with XRE-family HTH domain
MKDVGRRLKWVRQAMNMSQQQVADLLGIDRSSWALYERGQRLPDHYRVPVIAGRLRISVGYILSGSLDGVDRNLAIALASEHPQLARNTSTELRTGTHP